jgi:hypothetical protein
MKSVLPLNIFVAAASLALCSDVSATMINNGPPGPGHFQVDSLTGGDANYAAYNPGTGLTDLLYSLAHFVDVGANGGGVDIAVAGTVTTSATLLGPNVLSTGFFAGQNGLVNWTAVASILPTATYSVSYVFTSPAAFGSIRFIQYMDADIVGSGGDNLIVQGMSGQPGFQLLTVDSGAIGLGLAQSADFLNVTGMTYAGWAARPFSSLVSAITGAGASYSVPGVITGIPSTIDGRFPGSPAYGTADITSAIAFDFNPNASSATMTFTMAAASVPEPGTWILVLVGAGLVGLGRLKRN